MVHCHKTVPKCTTDLWFDEFTFRDLLLMAWVRFLSLVACCTWCLNTMSRYLQPSILGYQTYVQGQFFDKQCYERKSKFFRLNVEGTTWHCQKSEYTICLQYDRKGPFPALLSGCISLSGTWAVQISGQVMNRNKIKRITCRHRKQYFVFWEAGEILPIHVSDFAWKG